MRYLLVLLTLVTTGNIFAQTPANAVDFDKIEIISKKKADKVYWICNPTILFNTQPPKNLALEVIFYDPDGNYMRVYDPASGKDIKKIFTFSHNNEAENKKLTGEQFESVIPYDELGTAVDNDWYVQMVLTGNGAILGSSDMMRIADVKEGGAISPDGAISNLNVKRGTSGGRKALILDYDLTLSNMGGKNCELRVFAADKDRNPVKLLNAKENDGLSYKSFSTTIPHNSEGPFHASDFKTIIPCEDIRLTGESDELLLAVMAYDDNGEWIPGAHDIAECQLIREHKASKEPAKKTATAPETPSSKTSASKSSSPKASSPKASSSKTSSSKTSSGLLYQGEYYYTGMMSSGAGFQKACPASKSFIVKIYTDRIEMDGKTFRRNGYSRLYGYDYEKYNAVTANGSLMPDVYLLRDGKVITEIHSFNLMGFQSYTQTQIVEGKSNGEVYYNGDSGASSSYSSGNNSQSKSKSPKKCTLCNGTGHWGKNYASQYSNSKKQRCAECGEWDYIHYHPKCPSCNGKGYY